MMPTPVFVDSAQYIAFLYEDDELHEAASEAAGRLADVPLVTTEAILVEVLNFLSKLGPDYRRQAVVLVDTLRGEPTLLIEPQTTELLQEGIELYRQREDKSYSVTDCMSMVTCRRHGITEVATHDHHFVQEGYTILLT
jgi:predicted nucleic acid-binding protein